MDENQKLQARALGTCTFLPASNDKRFVRDMVFIAQSAEPKPLTEKQAQYLTGLCWKYRRQLLSKGKQYAALVPAAKPGDSHE